MEKNFFSFASEMLDELTTKIVSPLVPSLAGGPNIMATCGDCYGSCVGDCLGGCQGDCRGNCLGCDGSCEGLNR